MNFLKKRSLVLWSTVFVLFFGVAVSNGHAKAIEGVVNVNSASPTELTLLPGIGKAKAAEIVKMRQNKPFSSIEDLKAIKGIGPKRLEILRPHVAFSGPTTAKKSPKKKKSVASAPSAKSGSSK